MASTAVEVAILLTAKDAASGVIDNLKAKFESLGPAGKLAVAGVTALTTAGIGVGTALFEMASNAAESASEVRRLARETGLTTEEVSKLRYAGGRLNIDTDMLSKSFGIFSKNLETAIPKLEEYGVQTIRNKDGTVSLGGTIDVLADKFKDMPDGVEKTNLAMQLFGRSGKDMIPFLNQGSHGLMEMGDEAGRLGLVFSKEGVESARQFGLAQKDLGDRLEGVKNTIGIAVLPMLTNLIDKAVEIADVVMPRVVEVFKTVKGVFSAVGEILDVFTGKNKSAGGEMRNLIGDAAEPLMAAIARMREAWEKLVEKVLPLIQKLSQFVSDHMDTIQAVISTVMDTIGGIFSAAWDAIVGIFDTFMLLLDGNWSGAWDKITETMRNFAGAIGGIALHLGEKIVTAILEGLGTLKTAAGNAIGGALRDAIDGIDFWVGPFHVSGRGGVQFSMPSFGSSGPPAMTPNVQAVYRGFATGTPYVPQDMLALLHKGEAVIPAAQNAAGGAPVTNVFNIGTVDSDARVEQLANAVGRVFTQQRRLQGLA